jgi:23S rRNA (guanosine2251-2'-O)-methyltransferase
MPIARVTNLGDTLLQLKERGYWVAGLDGEAEETVWTLDWDRAIALVVGSEGSGLGTRVRDTCDFLVSIPMRGPAESLNASVATGVTLFAAVRDRP